jgi:phage tail-like protein
MSGETQNSNWPLPKFHFEVIIGEEEWYFQEVSGLETEVEVLEYRHGKSKQFANFKMPGMNRVSDVVLKKGVFTGDTKLFDWYKANRMNIGDRKTVTISLLNEKHKAEIVWTLTNAFPKKIESTNLNAQGNEIAIETITLSHEELNISVAPKG